MKVSSSVVQNQPSSPQTVDQDVKTPLVKGAGERKIPEANRPPEVTQIAERLSAGAGPTFRDLEVLSRHIPAIKQRVAPQYAGARRH